MDFTAIGTMLGQLSTDITGHKWMMLAGLLTSWAVSLLSQESSFPISLPASWSTNRWKPLLVLLATMVTGIIAQMTTGADFGTAVLTGAKTGLLTLGAYTVIVKAVFNGAPPAWANKLALIFPAPPPVSLGGVDHDHDHKVPPPPPPGPVST